jgi:two-component system chemotaxis sensor kinase CheA
MNEHEQALRRQLAALFAEELADRVDELRRVAGELDAQPESAEGLAALHRVLHVIKGASRSVGEESVEGACHRVETILAERGTESVPTRIVYDLADALDEARAALRAGASVIAQRFERIAAAGVADVEPPQAPSAAPGDVGETLRVDAAALDDLVTHSAEVVQARQSLTPALRVLEQLRDELRMALGTGSTVRLVDGRQWLRSLERSCRDLSASAERIARGSEIVDDQIRRLRLRPFEEVVSGCARIVRDAAASLGKQVELTVDARGVQLDRVQVEGLRDVMVQLVRNAVTHGIEDPAVRKAAGKPERGEIRVEASAGGDSLRIEVRDDGAGLDATWLERMAAARGRSTENLRETARLIFEPGISSAPAVTELAGRGVGLDVVRQRVERLHGSIGVDWIPNGGTTFSVEVPITVATLRSLIIESAGTAYALPITAIERLLWVASASVQRGETRSLFKVGGDWLVLARLGSVLGTAGSTDAVRAPGMVLSHAGRRVVIVVDRIIDTLDLAFEPLDPRLGRVRYIAGASTLPDGAVALVLQSSDLMDAALGTAYAETFTVPADSRPARTVLLVDDSATTRALEANILRAAGYTVRTAVDGQDAWRQLGEMRSDVIVSDVDMPNLSGIELTERVRATDDLAGIPIILVSARGSDHDKARGMQAGANAYIVKSSFDQTVLLETLTRLL